MGRSYLQDWKNMIFSINKPPEYFNLLAFFKKLGKYLNQACKNYNFIVMGDFNININQTSSEPRVFSV